MIRPTCILNIDVDASLYDEENTPVELRRSYLYIAPLRVNCRPTPAEPYPAENIMGMTVKLRNHPYWVSESDPQADEMWTEVMKPWMDAKLLKIENTVLAFNRRKKEDGVPGMNYGHLEIKMYKNEDSDGEYTFSFKSYKTSEFADVFGLLDRFRVLLNTGCLKGMENDIERVEFPWLDPEVLQAEWDARVAAEEAAVAEQKAIEEAAAAKEAAEAELSEEELEAAREAERLAALPLDEEGDYDDSDFAGESKIEEDEYEDELDVYEDDDDDEEDEYIDYKIWEITFADGSKRRLDSEFGAFID